MSVEVEFEFEIVQIRRMSQKLIWIVHEVGYERGDFDSKREKRKNHWVSKKLMLLLISKVKWDEGDVKLDGRVNRR